ncbi:MAG: hypothetical protein JWM82_737 [Myxococcales bacterium]|nr:hypothetical protein [Myxococcales bacterium]
MTHALLALATLAAPASPTSTTKDDTCVDARLTVVGALGDRWREALTRACAQLATMADRDPGAKVSVSPSGRGLVLLATSANGRSASRHVEEPAALLPTLAALLTIPPGARATHVSQAVEPEIPAAASVPSPPAPRSNGEPLDVSWGGTVGARLSGPRAFLFASPSGFFEVAMGGWAVALGMRWDELLVAEDVVAPGFEMDALSVSVLVARRWALPFGRFDLGVAPRLVAESQSYRPPTGERGGTSTDIRPALVARLELGRQTRFLVDLDADVSPSRLRRDLRIDPELPRLQSWSVGLAVGAAWGGP